MNQDIKPINGFSCVKTQQGGHVAKVPDGTPVYYNKSFREFYQWCCGTSVAATDAGVGIYALKQQK